MTHPEVINREPYAKLLELKQNLHTVGTKLFPL